MKNYNKINWQKVNIYTAAHSTIRWTFHLDEGMWLFRFVLLNKYSTNICRMYIVYHKYWTLNFYLS